MGKNLHPCLINFSPMEKPSLLKKQKSIFLPRATFLADRGILLGVIDGEAWVGSCAAFFLHSSASKDLTDFLLCGNLILGAIVPKRVGEPIKRMEKDEGWMEMRRRKGFWGDCLEFWRLGLEILMESKRETVLIKDMLREYVCPRIWDRNPRFLDGFVVGGELEEVFSVWDEKKRKKHSNWVPPLSF